MTSSRESGERLKMKQVIFENKAGRVEEIIEDRDTTSYIIAPYLYEQGIENISAYIRGIMSKECNIKIENVINLINSLKDQDIKELYMFILGIVKEGG